MSLQFWCRSLEGDDIILQNKYIHIIYLKNLALVKSNKYQKLKGNIKTWLKLKMFILSVGDFKIVWQKH